MKFDKEAMLLYAITDRTWLGYQTLAEQVEEALKGGATCMQLREKDLDADSFMEEAIIIKELCQKYKVPFIINDNVELAVACDADGVHVGQGDMPVAEVRKRIGADKILGVSAQTIEQAKKAQQDGADYLGVGAVFTTSTKKDANTVTKEMLNKICEEVSIPVVAIGGISKFNLMQLKGSGIDGVAVVSAIFASSDIEQSTKELLMLSKQMVEA